MCLDHTIRQSQRQAASEERTKLAQLLHDSTRYALTARVGQLNILQEPTWESAFEKRIAPLANLVRENEQRAKEAGIRAA